MLLPGRHGSVDSYRYGFQGQEKDDEIKGEANSINYKFRMHDPRLGRFFGTDPLERDYPYLTPYQFGANQVIHAIELEGLENERPLGPYGEWAKSRLAYYSKIKESGLSVREYEAQIRANNANNIIRTLDNKVKQGTLKASDYGLAFGYGSAKSNDVNGDGHITKEEVIQTENDAAFEALMLVLPIEKAFGYLGRGFNWALGSSKAYTWTPYNLGRLGERTVQIAYGGAKKTFTTLSGKTRYVDNFINGVAYESKVGYKSATDFIKKQFQKDLELLDAGQVDEVVWTFMNSPATGKGGASKPLLKLFEQAQKKGKNIRTEMIEVSQKAVKEVTTN